MTNPTTGHTTPRDTDQNAFGISPAGERLAEAHADARRRGGEGRWIAAKLSDGRTDGNIYDTREEAIRHQLHETLCCYVLVQPGLMPPREASEWLRLNRQIYDAGYRISDSDTLSPIVGQGDFAQRARIAQGLQEAARAQLPAGGRRR